MKEEETIRLIDGVFKDAFNPGRYMRFIQELFDDFRILPQRLPIWREFKNYIDEAYSIGTYVDGRQTVGVLYVRLMRSTSRDRARTMQRNFIAKFLNNEGRDAALVAFYGDDHEDWRFSFVRLEYELGTGDDGRVRTSVKLTPARRFSYLVGKNEPNHTCRERFLRLIREKNGTPILADIEDCFSVENVTDEFFKKYEACYLNLKESLERALEDDPICKAEFEEKEISTVDFSKKLLGQIVFLYFLQKKGWLGVRQDPATGRFQEWGMGPKDFMRRLYDGEIVPYKNFFNDILEPLFYEALAEDRSVNEDYYSRFRCKIPFLNGGLFEPIQNYNWVSTYLRIENEVFGGILKTFDEFNFTIKEDEPLEREVAVDPEMLGKVFENLLDVIDRKSKGAFYTPRDIVHYMCQQSLIGYLANHTSIPRDDLELFIRRGDVTLGMTIHAQENGLDDEWFQDARFTLPESIRNHYAGLDSLLCSIRVADPAVGSGAFPVGMMNEIVKARSILTPFFAGEDADRSIYELKRQTIENSLYGVDIDSSAVDITKLRFWLSLIVDEENIQTIRPLPNLDHRIMCGNSLVDEFEGVSLFDEGLLVEPEDDPEAVTASIDARIEDLGEELHRILTGAEEGDSARIRREIARLEKKKKEALAGPRSTARQVTFDQAASLRIKESRRKLRELKRYQRLFFNEQNRARKNEYRAAIERLEWDLIEETLKEAGNTDACRKLAAYRKNRAKPFFLWKLYFSEVFLRQNPGFDVVIANPPYVRQESIREQKAYFKEHYCVYQGTADLYVYFVERGVNLLAAGGVFTYILPNKWMRANYGKPLRAWLKERRIEEIIDFGDLPVFESATTYPCILRIGAGAPRERFDAVQVENLDYPDLTEYVKGHSYPVNLTYLDDGGWSLADEKTQALLEKIKAAGVPLGTYVDGKIYYGIKTGLNEAFVIDEATRERLIAEDPRSAEVIKPFLAGRDVKRYQPLELSKYLIFTRRGINIDSYPAIGRYLKQYKEKLIPRPRDWPSDKPWLGRKAGSYQWYEVQDSIDYYLEFEKPKIIVPAIVQRGSYTYDERAFYSNDKTSIIPCTDIYLLGILNSKVADFIVHLISSTKQGGYYEYKPMYVSQIPIRTIDPSDPTDVARHDRMVALVEKMLDLNKRLAAAKAPHEKEVLAGMIDATDRQIDRLVYELYGLTEEEIAVVEGTHGQ
ncbi:Eco57I restriction-modification methylase domain-containing protein [Methanoculleus methanifontis]|uniref:Eco57I restriction-modification methylase domain-containing protein n=1 Tax=Methanoculleus methanifontis TaxID=2584086 RepID=UPI00265A8E25|nr:TaqI-like C-terminal specificity domain-containing protein [Methanoculleus sp. FWC-SCC3]